MHKTPAQVQAELQALLQSDEADDLYDALPDTCSGKVMNSDTAREISPDYQTFEGRVAYTIATYRPAADYVYNRFLDTVRNNHGPGRYALILAGGPASGKTSSLKDGAFDDYALVYDTTFSNYPRALQLVQTLLDCKWEIQIQYIHRPYELAVESMLERAARTGRYVSLAMPSRLAQAHYEAQQCFLRISKSFRSSVRFDAIANYWCRDNPVKACSLDVNLLDVDGHLHYHGTDDLYAVQDPIFDSFVRKNKDKSSLIAAIQAPKQ